jgi:AcrR family transcriptional regulator
MADDPGGLTGPVAGRAKADHRRDAIVACAVRLMADQGYAATSIGDIARAAGIRKPSIYYYIKSKEDLLYQIHEMLVDELLGEAERRLADAETPEEGIVAFFAAGLRVVERRHREMMIFLNERHVARAAGRRWREVGERRDAHQRLFERVVEQGVEQGLLRDLPTSVSALGMLGMVSWAHRWYRPDGPIPADEMAALFASVVLDGIGARSEPTVAAPSSRRRRDAPAPAPPPATRERILRCAEELFAAKGFDNTTITDIAEAAGLGAASLYHYMAIKDDLLFEISRSVGEELLDVTTALLDEAPTHEDRVRALLIGGLRVVTRRRAAMTVYLFQPPGDGTVVGRWRQVVAAREEYRGLFEQVLREGRDAGAFRNLLVTPTALGLIGTISWANRWYRHDGGMGPDEVGELFADIVLHGWKRGDAAAPVEGADAARARRGPLAAA